MDCINLIFTCITIVISARALCIAKKAYEFTQTTYLEDKKQNQIRATVSDFPQLRRANQELVLQISALDETEKELCLKSYLSQMEHFAVGVNTGAYDIDIVDRMSGGMLINQYKKHLKEFIEHRRRDIEHPEVKKEEIYCEYIKMMKSIYEKRGQAWED